MGPEWVGFGVRRPDTRATQVLYLQPKVVHYYVFENTAFWNALAMVGVGCELETETTASTKPTQTVASAKRSVNNKSQKTVRLTPSQVTIAKKLGVPLELYAKQLNITKER